MAVLALVDDLFFRSKLQAAAEPLGVTLRCVAEADASTLAGEWSLIIVDLNLNRADPLDAIQRMRQARPSTPIVAYFSHVQVELQQRAQAAGCSVVLPRSAFVQRLPQLLAQG